MADSNGTSTTEGKFASDKGSKTRKATFARRNSNSALQTLVDLPEESLSPKIPLLCDDDDQDVIDCSTSDIDSDVEVKSTRKSGGAPSGVITRETASEKKRDDPAPSGGTNNAIDKSLDEVSSDEDMFEMMKDTPPRETPENPQIIQPTAMPAVETEAEGGKLINGPLRKEMVPEITISDDEDNQVLQTTSQESLTLQIDIHLNAASEAISKRKAIDSGEEPSQKVGNESANEANQNGQDNDDSQFNKIHMNMYQNFGDLDYEPDDDEQRSPVRVKTEPGTVAERMGRLDPDDMITIDLLSSDEDLPKSVAAEPDTVKSGRKRNRKKRSCPIDACLQLKHISSEESFSKSSQSEKSLIYESSILSLEELHSDDRRMSLRKRTITVLPGAVLSTSGRKNKMRKLFNDPESINEALKKSARRTTSKCSLVSTESSVDDDQIPAEASTSKTSQVIPEEPRVDKNDDQIGREQSTESFDLEQAIAKELEKEASDSQKSPDIPVATTDIALEDMLGMLEKEEEEEKASDLFHSRSTEENIWLENLFTKNDENAQAEEVGEPSNEIQNNAIEETDLPIVARYTVYEPDPNNPKEPAAIVAETETGQHHNVQQLADAANPKKLQRFKIVQNISKYPPPQKAAAPKTRKRVKRTTAGGKTRQKGKRRASNDDSDYTPEPSYARTRRFSTRSRKPPTSRTRDSFVPTGEYISEDSELLQHTQSEPPELEQPPLAPEGGGGTMSMPSLEEDLAMSSSESSVTMAQPSGCSLHAPAEGQQSVELIAEDNGKSTTKEKESRKKPVPGRKRGRPRVLQQQISDYFCPTFGDQQGTCKASCCQVKPTPNEKSKAAAPAKPTSTKVTRRRKIVSISSSSEDETGSMSFSGASTTAHSASTCTTGEDDSIVQAGEESTLSVTENAVAAPKDGLQIVLSPLTAEQIRIINTPRKTPKLSKTTQTEIGGLTVKIPWERINFSSQYFVNLRMLLSHGASRPITGQVASSNGRVQRRLENNFELVTIPNREAAGADSPSPPPPPIRMPPRSAAGRDRSIIDDLLYNRADGEIPLPPTSNSEDRRSSLQIIKSVNSNFRIPKLCKQPSTSPEIVTSSTSHANDQQEAPPATPQNSSEVPKYQPDPSSAANQDGGGGYNNDDPGEGCSNLSHRPSNSDRTSPMRFANALNSGYRPAVIIRKEEEPRNVGQSYVRSGLPDRADLVNVKRTIQNDTPQVQQQQQLQQSRPTSAEMIFKPPLSFPSFGSFEPQPPQQYGTIAGGSFNRGFAGFPPAFSVDNAAAASIFGMNPFSNLGLLEMFMLYQMRQQQQQSIIGNPFAGQAQALQSALARPTQPTYSQQQMGLPASIPSAEPLFSSNENTEMVAFLYGCQDFLTGNCKNPHCRRSHALPSEAEVHKKLLNQNQNFIMVTYQFVASQDKLFIKYFPVYASVMGKHHMRHQLVNTIVDCEKPDRPIEYYRLVVEGLQMSGTSISAAVQIVLEKHTKRSFHQINVLVDLIINTGDGIPKFLEWLEGFLVVQEYKYELAAVNRLIEACLRFERPSIELLKFVSKLVLNVRDADIQLVNTTALLEFVNNARQVPDLALEVGEIVGKYGRVEVVANR